MTDRSVHSEGAARCARRGLFAAAFTAVAAATLLLASGAASAGRAQVGSGIGLYATWDVLSGATTGQGLRDGSVVRTVSVSGDPSAASIDVDGALVAASVRLDSAGVLAGPDGTGLAFSGHKSAEADRAAGVLRLGGASSHVAYDANGYRREAWVSSGYTFAEVVESFELRYAASRAEPVMVSLRFTIDGTVSGNQGDNGHVNGLQLYAILGNTDQGAGQVPGLSPAVWRTETSASGLSVDVTGTVLGGQCRAGQDWCESFITLYAGMDLRSRVVADGTITSGGPTGAPFEAGFTARMALNVSPGVTVLQYDNRGEYEPLHGWVNPSAPVPEPASWALLLAGVAGLGALARRRRSTGPA